MEREIPNKYISIPENRNGDICFYSLMKFHFYNLHRLRSLHLTGQEDEIPAVLIHPIIRNYRAIEESGVFLYPQIVDMVELDTHERVAILKTIWIRLIQRTWKRRFAQRREMLLERQFPDTLAHLSVKAHIHNTASRCQVS